MSVSFGSKDDSVEMKLAGMIDRGKAMRSFLNRNIYRIYQNAQRKRWFTENASEGKAWDTVKEPYRTYKLKKYASYDGSGSKTMVATGALFKAVVGPSNGQYKIVTDHSMTISTSIEYAKYADIARSFTTWGDEFKNKIKQSINDFLILQKEGSPE